jgi:hypothetical protein
VYYVWGAVSGARRLELGGQVGRGARDDDAAVAARATLDRSDVDAGGDIDAPSALDAQARLAGIDDAAGARVDGARAGAGGAEGARDETNGL